MGLLQPAHGSPTPFGSDRPENREEKNLLNQKCFQDAQSEPSGFPSGPVDSYNFLNGKTTNGRTIKTNHLNSASFDYVHRKLYINYRGEDYSNMDMR